MLIMHNVWGSYTYFRHVSYILVFNEINAITLRNYEVGNIDKYSVGSIWQVGIILVFNKICICIILERV